MNCNNLSDLTSLILRLQWTMIRVRGGHKNVFYRMKVEGTKWFFRYKFLDWEWWNGQQTIQSQEKIKLAILLLYQSCLTLRLFVECLISFLFFDTSSSHWTDLETLNAFLWPSRNINITSSRQRSIQYWTQHSHKNRTKQ